MDGAEGQEHAAMQIVNLKVRLLSIAEKPCGGAAAALVDHPAAEFIVTQVGSAPGCVPRLPLGRPPAGNALQCRTGSAAQDGV